MRLTLRLIAAWLAINAIAYAPGTWRVFKLELSFPTPPGKAGLVMLACLAVLAILGAVELWRLRERGRRLAVAYVLLTMTLLIASSTARGDLTGAKNVARLVIRAAICGLLLSGRAREICRSTAPAAHPAGAG